MFDEIFSDIKKTDRMNDFEKELLVENLLKTAGSNREEFVNIIRSIKFRNDPDFQDYNLWDIYSILINDMDSWQDFLFEELKRLFGSYTDESSLKDINYFLLVFNRLQRGNIVMLNGFSTRLIEIVRDKNDFIKIISFDLILGLLNKTGSQTEKTVLDELAEMHEAKDWKVRVLANRILKKYRVPGYDRELSIFDKIKAGSLKIV